MADAARAIIIENDKMLLMKRIKDGSQYFTLVGGRRDKSETIEDCLQREIFEETGLKITEYSQVYYEPHAAPYNDQYIFVCRVAPHNETILQEYSEEALLNKSVFKDNKHEPVWLPLQSFKTIPFRTPQLQEEILKGLKKGFPRKVVHLR